MSKRKLLIIFYLLSLLFPLNDSKAFTVLSTNRFAWSNNVGYINFEGVTVSDSALTGFAWSANKGFINFAPAQSGVLNDGTGNLSGFAWGEQLGYIDFDNVNIDGATGEFSGTASGSLAGTITFDCPNFCDVVTDWRSGAAPTPTPAAAGSGGGGRSRIIGSSGAGGGNGLPAATGGAAGGILLPNAGVLPALINTALSPVILSSNPGAEIASRVPVKVPNISVELPNAGPTVPPGNAPTTNAENSAAPFPTNVSQSTQNNLLSSAGIAILVSILMLVLAYVLFRLLL